MTTRFGFALTMTLMLAGAAAAQTQVIVQDNFDQYADRAAFLDAWGPANGIGHIAIDSSNTLYTNGILTDDAEFPSAIPNVQGKAVDHLGSMVNQWGGAYNPDAVGDTPAFTINPTATQSVFLSADIFVGSSGNERMSVGLRATLPDSGDTGTDPDTANLIELGSWNANPDVLGVPGTAQVSAHFAFRAQLFGGTNPNWQYFELPIELDRTTDADEIVNVSDIGANWHTYAATVTPTSITFTIDLYRDGKRNTSTVVDTETGERPGIDGEFDGTVTVAVNTSAAGFNNLRVGGASGLTSAGAGLYGFDNILLQLQAAAVIPGGDNADFNGDDIVDGNDFLIWQRNFGSAGTPTTGDANGDLAVNGLDLDLWKTQFGTNPNAAPAVAAIPEPATASLAAVAMLAGLAYARRKRA